MIVKARGLVVRETPVGDSDVILTVLTHELGKISVSAKCIKSYKNKNCTSCRFLCYSDFILRKGKDFYFLNQSDLIKSFFGISASVEKLALSVYIGQIVSDTLPDEKEMNNQLSLLLNTLYVLEKKEIAPLLVKIVFELRFMADCGYMPSFLACTSCGLLEFPMYFDVERGSLLCADCAIYKKLPVFAGAYEALRYIITAPVKSVFSFKISNAIIASLAEISEKYLLYHTDKPFKSLDYLKNFL